MPTVTLQHADGRQESATIAEGKPLLMALEAAGSKLVPVGCRGGGCGICRIRILAGDYERKKMSRLHVSESDEANGITLSCRTVALGDLTIALATSDTLVTQQQKTAQSNHALAAKS